MDHHPAQPERIQESIPSELDLSSSSIDLWLLFWRRKWLLLLGLIVGLGAGYLQYTRQPPVFSSSARIQVVEPVARIPLQGIDPSSVGGKLSDEAMVMRSEKVLLRAVELGNLTEDELFRGTPPEAIATRIRGVNINAIGGARDSAILDISYQCGNPGSSRNVVQAVIDAYADHLTSQHANVGKETLDLIKAVRGEVGEKLLKLETDYDEFKRRSPLIYRKDERTSMHRENADKFFGESQELLVRRARLISKLKATKDAIEAKEPPEAILMMLQETSFASNSESTEEASGSRRLTQSFGGDAITMSRADTAREQQLLPLQLRETELLNQYGFGHPLVKDIQSQIVVTKGLIDEIAKNEQQLKVEREKAREKARKAALDIIVLRDSGEDIAKQVNLHILAMQQQLKVLIQEMEFIDGQYKNELRLAKEESAAEIESARYERDISRQQTLYEKIMSRFDELNIMSDAEGMKVIPLEKPKFGYQTGPSLSRTLGMGGAIGFLCVLGLAYLLEWSNRAYRSAEEIAEHLKLPVLGHIPITAGDSITRKAKQKLNSKLSPVLCSYFRSESVQSESYRAIRTALFFSNQGHGQQVLQVTSAVPADGKTTIASNIAISMAQMGKSVLLVDADMRRPQVDKVFGIDETENKYGLSWLLQQVPANGEVSCDLTSKAIESTEIANLSVMLSGQRPNNPAELLASSGFDHVMDALRQQYDIIIVDTPPLLAVTDPSNVAPRVDGVLLVIRLRKDARPLAAQASRMLATLDAKVIGVVINGVGSREAGEYGKSVRRDGYQNNGRYYQYGYGYTYGYSYGGGKYGQYYLARKDKSEKPVPASVQ